MKICNFVKLICLIQFQGWPVSQVIVRLSLSWIAKLQIFTIMTKYTTPDKKRGIGKKIGTGILIAIMFFLLAGAVSLTSRTLINPWIPFSVAAVLALISGVTMWRFWKWVTTSEKFIWNYLCHVGIAFSLFSGAFFICNFVFSDKETLHKEKVSVVRVYREKRHHSKRVGRRYYAQGTPYYVYYMEVRFDDGRTKDLSIPFERYRRVHKGDSINIPVSMGLFKVPVIEAIR